MQYSGCGFDEKAKADAVAVEVAEADVVDADGAVGGSEAEEVEAEGE